MKRPSWMTVALFGAGGFLAGVLLVAVLGGAKGTTHTTTVHATKTVTHTQTLQAGTPVPDVVGLQLDEAIGQLDDAGFEHKTRGGGVFGVIDESNWVVVAQDPPAGTHAGDGATVRLDIERS